MYIEYATEEDIEEISEIWRLQNEQKLFRPLQLNELIDMVSEYRMMCAKENNKIIGICGYSTCDLVGVVELCNLWVSESYRRNRVATTLISGIMKLVSDAYIPVVHCRDGAENNNFYEKYKLYDCEIHQDGVIKVRTYLLDKVKINSNINSEITYREYK